MEKDLSKEAKLQEEAQKMRDALAKYFEPADEVKAQHILYQEFVAAYGPMLNKLQTYISWHLAWGFPSEVDAKGSLGFKMKVIQPKI